MPFSLIQLVSEQTLPNVLPALALEPAEVWLLHTARTASQAGWIQAAFTAAGLACVIRTQELSPNPEFRETGQAVRQAVEMAREAGLSPVVNFTGGTKLMSIGAFACCLRHKVPGFYFESEPCRALCADAGAALPAELAAPDLQARIEARLRLEVLLTAHGVGVQDPGRDPAPWLPLARALAASRTLEQSCHEFVGHLREANPRTPVDFLALLERPLDDIPNGIIEPSFLAGMIVERDGHWYLTGVDHDRIRAWAGGERYENAKVFFAAVQPINDFLNLLDGGWWEVMVHDTARASGRYRDLRWSVVLHHSGGQIGQEQDILGLDGLNLALFSCKRGGNGDRLLHALERLEAAGRTLGGSQCKRALCIATAIPKIHIEEVQARAATTRTRLLGPADRLSPASFHQH